MKIGLRVTGEFTRYVLLEGFNWHDFNDGSLEVSRAPNA